MSSHAAWESYERSACQISAIGMVNSLGLSTDSVNARALAGDVSSLQLVDDLVPESSVRVGRVRGTLPSMPTRLEKYDFHNCRLLLAAFQQIEEEVAAAVDQFGAKRVAVLMGSSTAGIAVNEESVSRMKEDSSHIGCNAHLYQEMASVSQFLVEYAGLKGPFFTVSTACSSSTKVFSVAKRLMSAGIVDAAVVGGADTLSALTANGFHSLGLLSEEVSNPFSVNRRCIVIGEGATTMLLTRKPAGIQVLGTGESCDAYHFSAPDPSGAGAESAMRMAIAQAEIETEDVLYLNLHGTGSPANDKMEAEAVRRVFDHELWCSTTKPLTGHLLGASGATEIAISAASFNETKGGTGDELVLPPHIWDGERDEQLPELQFVEPGSVIKRPELSVFLSNSFAFGGSNASVVFASAV